MVAAPARRTKRTGKNSSGRLRLRRRRRALTRCSTVRPARRNDAAVIDERLETVYHFSVLNLDRADFYNFALFGFEAGCFQVEYDERLIHVRKFRFTLEIAFHAEDRLDAGLFRRLGFRRRPG